VRYWFDEPILPESYTTADDLASLVGKRFKDNFQKVREMAIAKANVR
jgi:hypothetical protein